MIDLTILHLSDLHIRKAEGDCLWSLYTKLLDDIEHYINNWKNVVIVVTGDIVDRCNYDARDTVLIFFGQLWDIVKDKCKGIYIVPGNHDWLSVKKAKECGSDADKWLNRVNRANILDRDLYNQGSKYFDEISQKYLDLVNSIYKIFNREIVSKPYGVDIIDIEGKKICFIGCSTALNTGRGSDKDKKRVRFGKYQLEELHTEYMRKKSMLPHTKKEIDITFLLMHHPMNWLKPADEEAVQKYAMSKDAFDVDFILCGHTHVQDLYNVNKNYKSMMTLATGIGWPESIDSERAEKHRYAIYNISMEANAMEIYNRSTNDSMIFTDDVSIYTAEQMQGMEKKIIFPIKSQRNKAYFTLSTVKGRTSRPFFYSDSIIEDFHKYRTKMNQWFFDAGKYLRELFRDLYYFIYMEEMGNKGDDGKEERNINKEQQLEQLRAFLIENDADPNESPKILRSDKYLATIYRNCDAFLQYICERMCRLLYDSGGKTEKVRVHFRYGYVENKEMHYRRLCAHSITEKGEAVDDISEAVWGDLIKAAYEAKHTLIYSVNESACEKKLSDKWDDYLTAIPDFPGNYVQFHNSIGMGKSKSKEVKRPLLSFGITVKGDCGNMLYYFDYVNISEAIGDLINEYILYTKLDFTKFVAHCGDEKYD